VEINIDDHTFVGRVNDLSVVGLNFDSSDQFEKFEDINYALWTNYWLSALVNRVHSLNIPIDMTKYTVEQAFVRHNPLGAYDWLNVTEDVFLMRSSSVVDCLLILMNEIEEIGETPKKCVLNRLQKKGLSKASVDQVDAINIHLTNHKNERNERFHHGLDNEFTDDDRVLKLKSNMIKYGTDINTSNIPAEKQPEVLFKKVQSELGKKYSKIAKIIADSIYVAFDKLEPEFESRFSDKYKRRTHKFGSNNA